MKFHEFIQPQAVIASLQSPDRDGVIREMVAALEAAGSIPVGAAEAIVESLLSRERNGTTGIGRGVATPHCKCVDVPALVGAVGISARGVDFNALDQKPVYVVFMLLSPQGRDACHLQAMEVVFKNLNKDSFRKTLRMADTREKVVELLAEADAGQGTVAQ
jgi:mannitol/fructose-specific phosphotransferase system IIA component (Ntr-type)